jgi:hypothetical protein
MFLGGAAGLVALPFLPSLLPRSARADDVFPTRLLFLHAPNGVRMDLWRPVGVGADFAFGPSMAQLEDVREHITVVSGLENAAARGDRPGDHARGTGAFLTCRTPSFDVVENGVSVDQVIADALAGSTPFRSLELGVEAASGSPVCDSGYSCAYVQNIAWSSATTPMPKLSQPQTVFDRLFAGFDARLTDAQRLRRRVYRASVLDAVTAQAAEVSRRIAVEDRRRLDEYLTGVRELELRVDNGGVCGVDVSAPGVVDLEHHADLLLDLAVAALACGQTRVVTMMLGNAGSNLVYSFLPGVRGAHHQLSHHQGLAENLDQLAVIDAWLVGRFARVVRKLAAVQEGDGSLLDHTLVMFGSEVSDGNAHNHDDLPVVLAGRGNGAVMPGRHLDTGGAPVANLFVSMMQAAGLDESTFGSDGAGPLAGLAG